MTVGRGGLAPGRSCGLRWSATPCLGRWSRHRDSNPEPAVYKTAALPIELRRRALKPSAGSLKTPGDDRSARANGSSARLARAGSRRSGRRPDARRLARAELARVCGAGTASLGTRRGRVRRRHGSIGRRRIHRGRGGCLRWATPRRRGRRGGSLCGSSLRRRRLCRRGLDRRLCLGCGSLGCAWCC